MKMTIFIAVVPQDYSSAHVELFETRKDAEQFIDESLDSIRTQRNHCSILEREILFVKQDSQ